MKQLLIAASTLALSAPALAQTTPATPPADAQSTAAEPMETAPAPAQDTGATAAAPAAAPSDPKALIAQEFPSYDKDGSGVLDKTEFAAWMGALKAKTNAPKMAPAEMTKWSDGAFATADKDKSKTVTLAELQGYLTGTA